LIVAAMVVGFLCSGSIVAHSTPAQAQQPPTRVNPNDDDPPAEKKTKKKRSKKNRSKKKGSKKKGSKKKKKKIIRWGQRRKETDQKYDKRYQRVIRKVKQDKRGDSVGGHFENAQGEEVRLWTYMGHPFIVRSDIDAKFTADTAMYMEMLHREYGAAYKRILGLPAEVKEKIEVIVFADQETYIKNGGTKGSGGFFNPAAHMQDDRGRFWPARHYRLQLFTGGITDFTKWEKGTLKHEAAHMELQLRLGYTLSRGMSFGIPVNCPRWWNEGHATVFEYWNFDKTVDENFAEIPNRGRYAPVIRRIFDTARWKDFNYVWTIDGATWHGDMTSDQGFLNYAQAWSLAAYMMNQGRDGRRDFRAIFDLSRRVGTDRQQTAAGDGMRAWTVKFPQQDQARLEKNWQQWVAENVSRDKRVPDEDWLLKRQGYKPEIVDRLVKYSKEEFDELREEIIEERQRRKKARTIEK
jgi:hypothetical protein